MQIIYQPLASFVETGISGIKAVRITGVAESSKLFSYRFVPGHILDVDPYPAPADVGYVVAPELLESVERARKFLDEYGPSLKGMRDVLPEQYPGWLLAQIQSRKIGHPGQLAYAGLFWLRQMLNSSATYKVLCDTFGQIEDTRAICTACNGTGTKRITTDLFSQRCGVCQGKGNVVAAPSITLQAIAAEVLPQCVERRCTLRTTTSELRTFVEYCHRQGNASDKQLADVLQELLNRPEMQ